MARPNRGYEVGTWTDQAARESSSTDNELAPDVGVNADFLCAHIIHKPRKYEVFKFLVCMKGSLIRAARWCGG